TDKAAEAAEAMGVTSDNLEKLGIVDQTIPEPMGGAHRDIETMASTLKAHLSEQLDELQAIPLDDLLERRYQRLMSYGRPD
ncbi:MAG: acetyl-CoA carboxylase carboxyl transferase subunit alpha, partial [Patiriisocius sp.]